MSVSASDSAAHAELLAMLWDLCEGRLTEESVERLNGLLLADSSCRRTYLDFTHIASELEWEHSGVGGNALDSTTREGPHDRPTQVATGRLSGLRIHEPIFDSGADVGTPPGAESVSDGASDRRPLASIAAWLQLDRMVSVSRAAAALLLTGTLCAGVLVMAVVVAAGMTGSSQEEPAGPPTYVAKLTRTHQVKWADDATSAMVDQLLTEGQTVEILDGWAEITFKSGVCVVLEGPAKLQCQGANRARLVHGKVATDEAARKVGFTLDTPTGRVVDLGAVYGVAVESERTMKLDVFAGAVEVRPVINQLTGTVGPGKRFTANQAIALSRTTGAPGKTILERLSDTDNHFVRTLRSKSHTFGSKCIARTQRDTSQGTVCFMRDPTTKSGRARNFSFYNIHAEVDRWITPIILAVDPSTGTYRVTGIGQSVLNLGSGLQTVPFQLIAGSGNSQAGVHTFGFYHGTVDKTGKATAASFGPLDYEDVPESVDPRSPLANEVRWLFVPAELNATPVQLRLNLEFSLTPLAGQIALWTGSVKHTKERVYSGSLEIVVEPEFLVATPQDDLVARLLPLDRKEDRID